jgi:hypothetical protein
VIHDGATDPSTDAPRIRGDGGAENEHAEHTDRCDERSDNAIRSQSRKSGADVKYLVGGVLATKGCVTEPARRAVSSADLRIS